MVKVAAFTVPAKRVAFFGIRALKGGKFHPKLNMTTRLIANKYREGKVKRTLKRELKVLEIVKGEANIAFAYAVHRFAFDSLILNWTSGKPRFSSSIHELHVIR